MVIFGVYAISLILNEFLKLFYGRDAYGISRINYLKNVFLVLFIIPDYCSLLLLLD